MIEYHRAMNMNELLLLLRTQALKKKNIAEYYPYGVE